MEPFVEDVEEGEQALLGAGASPLGLCLDEAMGPTLLAHLEEREHEAVLGREVPRRDNR